MSAINDGGPAFPSAYEYNPTYGRNEPVTLSGMSLRDYFAAQALPTVMEQADIQRAHTWDAWTVRVATAAYEIADAMLKAREPQP